MKIEPYFSKSNIEIEYVARDAQIISSNGEIIFERKGVEYPINWSQSAIDIVTSKYLQAEESVKDMIDRVVNTIMQWGLKGKYYDDESGIVFAKELTHMITNQMMSFNSPVWFNVGIIDPPQTSACFIQSVEDSLESISDLQRKETMLFKHGSGSGTNFSTLRSTKERLSCGGRPSGPVSFMKSLDANAGIIRSGGKTRRAARLCALDVNHPDIMEFIKCKILEERKAKLLVKSGILPEEAISTVAHQNGNNSVRVTDKFMKAVIEDSQWETHAVTNGVVMETLKAREVLNSIAMSAWECGDPAIQFHDTINNMNTCLNSGEIKCSNPCSEYMFLDESACNLASLNLMKFRNEDGSFCVESFVHAVELTILAQEILIDRSSYPTPEIEQNAKRFRALGLGYANLGALLMSKGLAYDSDEGRELAANITNLMTANAYLMSAKLAMELGPFLGYNSNKEPMMSVIYKHREKCPSHKWEHIDMKLEWEKVVAFGGEYGFRNAQVTLLAPTGTIGFMMDCDSTGIEPCMGLVTYKKLAGGGELKLVNRVTKLGLEALGYYIKDASELSKLMEQGENLENIFGISKKHLPVFDCSFAAPSSDRIISWEGHVKMMAAVQLFLSGAISKTVNLPNTATVSDVEQVYMTSWKLGLKSVSVYRDGCKLDQPVTAAAPFQTDQLSRLPNNRNRLPDERFAIAHKFSIAGYEGYLHVGLYPNGQPGELFVTMSKQGSTISGLLDAFATSISICLQMGVPIEKLSEKFIGSQFEPKGFTNNKKIRICTSITDYIFRWMSLKFSTIPSVGVGAQMDAPPCSNCGAIMVRNGSCYKCANCGGTSGCS